MGTFLNCLVLGIVPGTQFEVSFKTWLTVMASVLGAYLFVRYARQQHLLVALRVRYVVQTASYSQKLASRALMQG